jgi:hypothetical protein
MLMRMTWCVCVGHIMPVNPQRQTWDFNWHDLHLLQPQMQLVYGSYVLNAETSDRRWQTFRRK